MHYSIPTAFIRCRKGLKGFARLLLLTLVFSLSFPAAFAAEKSAYKAEDIDRWLGEHMKILNSVTSAKPSDAIAARIAQFSQAYDAGNVFASLGLQFWTNVQKNNAPDAEKARGDEEVRKWERIAQQNAALPMLHEHADSDMRAQSLLGYVYSNGLGGVPKDEAKAAKWYRKAAEQGDVFAQMALAAMYRSGRGDSPKDEAKAAEWCRKAAEQGLASAQILLGQMYETGSGVPQDEAKGLEWYRKAAEQGHYLAQFFLGKMYEWGAGGLPKDEAKAMEWYRKAAIQGYPSAQQKIAEHEKDAVADAAPKLPAGFIAIAPNTMTWKDAKAFCEAKGGRLPLIGGSNSLASVPAGILIDGFGNRGAPWPAGLPRVDYWTGTVNTDNPGDAWGVLDFSGNVSVDCGSQGGTLRVACVP